MKMNTEKTTIILGDEYDDALRDALLTVLKRNQAVGIDKSWEVAGSQQLELFKVNLRGDSITIESETYVGLTISGPRAAVEEIAGEVRAELKSSPSQ